MTKKLFSFLTLGSLIGLSLFSSLLSAPVSAAEFISGDSPSISDTKNDNVYISGGTVNVTGKISKDLVATGGTINITGQVERNILAAGGQITIDSDNITGAVRVAGGTVTLKGNFTDDVIVSAGTLKLDNAKIAGDLTVAVGTLDISNSQINGDLMGYYSTSSGDLDAQTNGKVDLKQNDQNGNRNRASFLAASANFAWEFSVVVGLLIVSFILNRRRILAVPGIRFDMRFVIDLLAGLGYLILPGIVFVFSVFLQVYPLVLLISGVIYLLFILSAIYFPIYLGNLIRNTLNSKANIGYFIGGSYVLLLIINLLGYLNGLFGILQIIVFIFYLASFGHLLRQIWRSLNQDLHSEVTESEIKVVS